MFFHGLSGTFGPAWFIIRLQRLTGRPMFVPEFPYLAMRHHSPAAILSPTEVVAAARRMIWRHGFGITDAPPPDDDEDNSTQDGSDDGSDEWRRGKVILTGHSLGSGMMGWVLRDAPDIVDGVVMVEPMSAWIYDAHGSRNFFRRTAHTAGEIFFRYFAQESGISHFMSKHLNWHNSVVFASAPAAPLPPSAAGIVPLVAQAEQDVGWDVPYYAPSVSPSPRGPIVRSCFFPCLVTPDFTLTPSSRHTRSRPSSSTPTTTVSCRSTRRSNTCKTLASSRAPEATCTSCGGLSTPGSCSAGSGARRWRRRSTAWARQARSTGTSTSRPTFVVARLVSSDICLDTLIYHTAAVATAEGLSCRGRVRRAERGQSRGRGRRAQRPAR